MSRFLVLFFIFALTASLLLIASGDQCVKEYEACDFGKVEDPNQDDECCEPLACFPTNQTCLDLGKMEEEIIAGLSA
nr:venom polypeptide precursor [Doratifera vulnerans]